MINRAKLTVPSRLACAGNLAWRRGRRCITARRYNQAWSAFRSADAPFGVVRLATDVAHEVEDRRLTFAERTHHFEALDRRVGRLHRFETAHRPNQLLEHGIPTD